MRKPFVAGVMQASHMGGTKLEKRYSPCFRDENGRKQSLTGKRKRDDVFKCVSGEAARTRAIPRHLSCVLYHISESLTYAGPGSTSPFIHTYMTIPLMHEH